MAFPEELFGKCPIHGGGGTDDPNSGSAFSTEDHTGEGYKLVYYQGKLMCELCRKRLMADDESSVKQAQYRENQEFWNKCGVRQTMED